MEVNTTRFGSLEIATEDLVVFPAGLLGMEKCRRWVLFAGGDQDTVAWLQSVERPEVALAVVSPRRFVPSYRMRVARAELAPLQLDDLSQAAVLVILGKSDHTITLNLKAPLVLHLERRLGRQVITNGNLPIRYKLGSVEPALRWSA